MVVGEEQNLLHHWEDVLRHIFHWLPLLLEVGFANAAEVLSERIFDLMVIDFCHDGDFWVPMGVPAFEVELDDEGASLEHRPLDSWEFRGPLERVGWVLLHGDHGVLITTHDDFLLEAVQGLGIGASIVLGHVRKLNGNRYLLLKIFYN